MGECFITRRGGGVSGIDFGELTIPHSTNIKTITVNHSLGKVPKWVALIPSDMSGIPFNQYQPGTISLVVGKNIDFQVTNESYSSSQYVQTSAGTAQNMTSQTITFSSKLIVSYKTSAYTPTTKWYWFALA